MQFISSWLLGLACSRNNTTNFDPIITSFHQSYSPYEFPVSTNTSSHLIKPSYHTWVYLKIGTTRFDGFPCYDFTSQGYVCTIFRHTHIPSYHLLAYPLISCYISPNHQWICSRSYKNPVDHLFTLTIAIMGISTISTGPFSSSLTVTVITRG